MITQLTMVDGRWVPATRPLSSHAWELAELMARAHAQLDRRDQLQSQNRPWPPTPTHRSVKEIRHARLTRRL